MILSKNMSAADRVLSYFPSGISREIRDLSEHRSDGALREIRLRAEGRASVRLGKSTIPLLGRVSSEELYTLLCRICDGAVYSQRDSICSGYVSMSCGVRVGVVGTAGYDSASLVGVEKISSLVFRIPTGECSFAPELERVFRTEGRGGGMLIYSPPGVGKTTALRALARRLGGGRTPMRVCVVDERFEFFPEDYRECEVDLLRGYKKKTGLDIAVRTMSPDIVMMDEIGAGEADAVLDAVHCGIPIVATAHARSADELLSKRSLKPLFESGAFVTLVGISDTGTGYELKVNKNDLRT